MSKLEGYAEREAQSLLARLFRVMGRVGVGLLLPLAPLSVSAEEATAAASARIVAPIAVTRCSGGSFGEFYRKDSPGVISLTRSGAAAGNGTSPTSVTSATVAEFSVAGDPDATFSLSLPRMVQLDDGHGHTLNVSNFTRQQVGRGPNPDGTQSVAIGATLNLPGRRPGLYSGVFQVTLEYN